MKRLLVLLSLITLAFGATQGFAQGRTVTGRVTSATTNSALSGALVEVPGGTTTRTDIDGRFQITVPATVNTLRVSMPQHTARVVSITGNVVNVALQSSGAVAVEGLVVTALGIERAERELGVATTTVEGESLSRTEPNLINSLNGRVPGVNITQTGPQGGSSRIVIRGENSVTGNNQPLFVIDGVPVDNYGTGAYLNSGQGGFDYGNAVQDIDPGSIESITVLKGPNAAALYGSRASNGVVLITTKNGRTASARGPEIVVSQDVTFDDELRLPDYQDEFGQGYRGHFEYFDGYNNGTYDGEDQSWGPPLDQGLMIAQYNSPIRPDGTREPLPWVSRPDNVDSFFDVGKTLTTNLSVAAGNEMLHGRFGVSRLDQDGMVPGFELERTTLTFGGGMDPSSRLNLNTSLQYNRQNGEHRPGVGYDENNPMQQFIWFGRQVDVKDLKARWQEFRPSEDPMAGLPYSWNYLYHPNPYFLQLGNTNNDNRDRLLGNLSASYQVTDWLTGMVRTGMDWYQDSRLKGYAAKGNKISGMYTTNPLTLNREYVGDNGAFATWDIGFRETNSEFLLTANPELNLPFTVSANFGGNRRDAQRNTDYAWVADLATPQIFDVSNAAVTPDLFTNTSRKRVNSLYGQADLGYNDVFFVTLTGRNDWSSTLPEENRSYFYPSVSTSLVFSDAIPALQTSPLTYGKVRASWARVGNDTNPYDLVNTFTADEIFGTTPTFTVPGALKNENLKPEITESIELGAELGFLEDRLGLDLTWYREETSNQIMPVELSRSTGFTSRLVNAGTVRNTGVELLARVTPIETGDFRWESTITWAKNNNEVVELAEGVDGLELSVGDFWGVQSYARVGEPYGQLYGTAYDRAPDGRIVVDAGGRPLPTTAPQVIGNFSPDWRGGWQNEFSYKGARLNFLFDTKQGGDIYSVTHTFGRYAGVLEETAAGRCTPASLINAANPAPTGYPLCTAETGIVVQGVRRVVTGGDTTYVENTTPTNSQSYWARLYAINESNLVDGSFVKLRELTLAYDLPASLIDRAGISGLQLALSGRNLFLWTENPHIDPESAFDNSNVQGFEYGQMPSVRSFGFNVTVRP